MLLFEPPPSTRYDLRFTLANIPVQVHPFFWVMTLLFGASSGDLDYLLIWVVVVFVSIVLHELGHALVMRAYGQPARVVLYALGGLAVPEATWWGSRWANVSLSLRQEILIALAGPGVGFLLAILVMLGVVVTGGSLGLTPLFGIIPWVTASLPWGGRLANLIVTTLLWVNLFWGLVNLTPVYPLDGGRVARYLFIQADPLDGARKSLKLSVVAGAVVAAGGLIFLRSTYLALLFGILAIQSYQSLRGQVGGGFG
jgi:stage IV sporulation protein FB